MAAEVEYEREMEGVARSDMTQAIAVTSDLSCGKDMSEEELIHARKHLRKLCTKKSCTFVKYDLTCIGEYSCGHPWNSKTGLRILRVFWSTLGLNRTY